MVRIIYLHPRNLGSDKIVRQYVRAARLAQLGERRSAEREAVGSNPGRTNTQLTR